jgi:hypothetical protein
MTVVRKLSYGFLFGSYNKCSTEDRIMKFYVSIDIKMFLNYRDYSDKLAITHVSVRAFVFSPTDLTQAVHLSNELVSM